MNDIPLTVHMVLIDSYKKLDNYPIGGFVPQFITLSISKAKEFLEKSKKGFIKAGASLELDTPNYFIATDGKWVTHIKIYSVEMDKFISNSDYENYYS